MVTTLPFETEILIRFIRSCRQTERSCWSEEEGYEAAPETHLLPPLDSCHVSDGRVAAAAVVPPLTPSQSEREPNAGCKRIIFILICAPFFPP